MNTLSEIWLTLPRPPRRHTSRSRSRSRSTSPRRLTLNQLKQRLNNAKTEYISYVDRYYGFVNNNEGLANLNNYNSNNNAPPKVIKRLKKAYKQYKNRGGVSCKHPLPFRRVRTLSRKLKSYNVPIECVICGSQRYMENNNSSWIHKR